MSYSVGIDFGTSNSVVSYKDIIVKNILNDCDELITPTVVMGQLTNDEVSFLIGKAAKNLQFQDPENTILSIKRFLGKTSHDYNIRSLINNGNIHYKINLDEEDVTVTVCGKKYTPTEISGIFLKQLIVNAEKNLQNKIINVVLSVPAYYNDRQKFETKKICEYAGVNLLQLISEPTAAAISFGFESLSEDNIILVIDFGGGTFDLCLLSYLDNAFIEIGKGGDMWLGGDNIDGLLTDYVLSNAIKSHDINDVKELISTLDTKMQSKFKSELREKVEAAKIVLSTSDKANIELFGILKDKNDKLVDIDVTISRNDFDSLISPLVEKIKYSINQLLIDNSFDVSLIDKVIMVGGGSLIPEVQKTVQNFFGSDKVHVHPRPLLAVAEGTAIMAQMLVQSNSNNSILTQSASHDYYLKLDQGKHVLLVAKNTPLPVSVTKKVNFINIDQFVANIMIFNKVNSNFDSVGEVWLHKHVINIEEMFFNTPKESTGSIAVDFTIDKNNLISLNVRLEKDNKQCSIPMIRHGIQKDLILQLTEIIHNTLNNIPDKSVLLSYVTTIIFNNINSLSSLSDKKKQDELVKHVYSQFDVLTKLVQRIEPLYRTTLRLNFSMNKLIKLKNFPPIEQITLICKNINNLLTNLDDSLNTVIEDYETLTNIMEEYKFLNSFLEIMEKIKDVYGINSNFSKRYNRKIDDFILNFNNNNDSDISGIYNEFINEFNNSFENVQINLVDMKKFGVNI